MTVSSGGHTKVVLLVSWFKKPFRRRRRKCYLRSFQGSSRPVSRPSYFIFHLPTGRVYNAPHTTYHSNCYVIRNPMRAVKLYNWKVFLTNGYTILCLLSFSILSASLFILALKINYISYICVCVFKLRLFFFEQMQLQKFL